MLTGQGVTHLHLNSRGSLVLIVPSGVAGCAGLKHDLAADGFCWEFPDDFAPGKTLSVSYEIIYADQRNFLLRTGRRGGTKPKMSRNRELMIPVT